MSKKRTVIVALLGLSSAAMLGLGALSLAAGGFLVWQTSAGGADGSVALPPAAVATEAPAAAPAPPAAEPAADAKAPEDAEAGEAGEDGSGDASADAAEGAEGADPGEAGEAKTDEGSAAEEAATPKAETPKAETPKAETPKAVPLKAEPKTASRPTTTSPKATTRSRPATTSRPTPVARPPAPAAGGSGATVSVSGDRPLLLWYEAGGKTFSGSMVRLEPGTYKIVGSYTGSPSAMGELEVKDGQSSVSISCDKAAGSCSQS